MKNNIKKASVKFWEDLLILRQTHSGGFGLISHIGTHFQKIVELKMKRKDSVPGGTYSRTSVARTLMAHLPRLFRTRS